MQGNNQPNQQKKDRHDFEQYAHGAGHGDPADPAKQAPAYNETPDQRNQDNDGEVNERDPAWRAGDLLTKRFAAEARTITAVSHSKKSQADP